SLLQDTPEDTPHKGATMIDDRYAITADERKKIIATYFDEAGFIKQFPSKEKRKLVVLGVLAERFDSGKNYSEAAVNDILKQAISDYVTVRRYLIEYGFMKRTNDGKTYWRT
ncbi:MAG TPA: LytTR family transcriptional regulator, partial [Enterococcus sp.]|nr:LytTR family transcriptional regulator [Enterococcus sp.]